MSAPLAEAIAPHTLLAPPLGRSDEPERGDAAATAFRVVLVLAAGALLAPFASLALTAADGSAFWRDIAGHVLPRALAGTAALLTGVGLVVLVVGVGTAWLVSAYDFPGRKTLELALVLPLAVPTYIVAFCYLDLLHPVGPVQTWLRDLTGIELAGGLPWFPEVRSTGMCAVLLGFVLYPYVYLPTRALFLVRAPEILDAARSLGAGPVRLFARVALPLARPGIVAGASLALMETLNDVGASEFLGVNTLTVSIYATWVNRSDLPGAAQLSLAALLVVTALIAGERWARRRQDQAGGEGRVDRRRLAGASGYAALAVGSIPVAIGFAAPASYLALESARRIGFAGLSPTLLREAVVTVTLAAAATALTVGVALVLACGARLFPSRQALQVTRVAALGYGVPGTILAVGLLAPLAGLDTVLNEAARRLVGVEIGLLALGSSAALIYAYVVRFLAIGLGAAESGLTQVPLALDEASRNLGGRTLGTVRRIHLPLTVTAVASGALLVFVDCMKELPATLLLRPLNVETLATHLYGEAARGTYEDGAVAALLIVAIGLVPLALLSRLNRA